MSGAQHDFALALLDPVRPVPEGLGDGAGGPAGCRFDVYRNNVAASLIAAMRVAFPVISRLLGQRNMDGISGLFLRAHPPDTPLMMHYGGAFPAFLESLPQLSHLGYLGDVARLELALRRSYHAADTAPADIARLPPQALLNTALRLSPATLVVRSDWPLFDIWRATVQDDAPPPRPRAQDVLITRSRFDPVPRPLPKGGADWIAALRAGHTMLAAQQDAAANTPEFDPGATLEMLLEGNAITAFTTKE
jgi:hypothetical protein